ncbi:MAG TPA: hypothetical protein VFH68_13600 [Polyangia bacterium]|jgi:hypothetical protein|nr:hypothetical protein [Polyangia bacterium]
MSDPVPPSSSPPTPPPPASESLTPEDEFAGIRSRAGRHPALALGAAALALFIIFHVRADLTYSLSSTDPIDLGDAAATFGGARPRAVGVPAETLERATNRYVSVRGTPDRESALELDTKGSWVFTQFFRILGTGSRLFVHRRENPLPGFRAEEDRFEGRLIPFADLSFEASIRGYLATHVSATHFFPPDGLRRAIAQSSGGALTVVDLAGDPVSLGPSDLLAIDLALPQQIRLAFPRDKFRDAGAARAEVEKRGGTVVASGEATATITAAPAPLAGTPPSDDRVVVLARFPPERRDSALGEIGDIDPRIEIRDARRTLKVRLGDLRDGGDALLVQPAEVGAEPDRLPIADIPAIRTLAAVQIPAEAWLLIESDYPRDHLRTVVFAAVLLAFAAINLLGLVRGLKRS